MDMNRKRDILIQMSKDYLNIRDKSTDEARDKLKKIEDLLKQNPTLVHQTRDNGWDGYQTPLEELIKNDITPELAETFIQNGFKDDYIFLSEYVSRSKDISIDVIKTFEEAGFDYTPKSFIENAANRSDFEFDRRASDITPSPSSFLQELGRGIRYKMVPEAVEVKKGNDMDWLKPNNESVKPNTREGEKVFLAPVQREGYVYLQSSSYDQRLIDLYNHATEKILENDQLNPYELSESFQAYLRYTPELNENVLKKFEEKGITVDSVDKAKGLFQRVPLKAEELDYFVKKGLDLTKRTKENETALTAYVKNASRQNELMRINDVVCSPSVLNPKIISEMESKYGMNLSETDTRDINGENNTKLLKDCGTNNREMNKRVEINGKDEIGFER